MESICPLYYSILGLSSGLRRDNPRRDHPTEIIIFLLGFLSKIISWSSKLSNFRSKIVRKSQLRESVPKINFRGAIFGRLRRFSGKKIVNALFVFAGKYWEWVGNFIGPACLWVPTMSDKTSADESESANCKCQDYQMLHQIDSRPIHRKFKSTVVWLDRKTRVLVPRHLMSTT